MTISTHDDSIGRRLPWRPIGWSIPVLLLLLPLAAGAPWTPSDYVTAGVAFMVAGLVIEVAVRSTRDLSYRLGAAVAVAAGFLLVWVILAVGFLGDGRHPANLVFYGLIAIALFGAFLAHFRAAGMARTMVATAACQLLVGIVALAAGWAAPGRAGTYEVVMGTTLFTGLWLASAWLFAQSARGQTSAGPSA